MTQQVEWMAGEAQLLWCERSSFWRTLGRSRHELGNRTCMVRRMRSHARSTSGDRLRIAAVVASSPSLLLSTRR